MIRQHQCPNCNHKGRIWLPKEAKKTMVSCPVCKKEEDLAYLLTEYKSVDDYEREEYERLRSKFK